MNHGEPVRDHPEQQPDSTMPHFCREQALTHDQLFHGTDELGREGWFLRIELTGMWPRRCGPFATPAEACAFFEEFLDGGVLSAFHQMTHDLLTSEQGCVVERLPTSIGTPAKTTCESYRPNLLRSPQHRADCSELYCEPDESERMALRGPNAAIHAMESAAEQAGRTWNSQLQYVVEVCLGDRTPSSDDGRDADDWRATLAGLEICVDEGGTWIPLPTPSRQTPRAS